MKSSLTNYSSSALRDTVILAVLDEMNARRKRPDASAFEGPGAPDPELFADYGF